MATIIWSTLEHHYLLGIVCSSSYVTWSELRGKQNALYTNRKGWFYKLILLSIVKMIYMKEYPNLSKFVRYHWNESICRIQLGCRCNTNFYTHELLPSCAWTHTDYFSKWHNTDASWLTKHCFELLNLPIEVHSQLHILHNSSLVIMSQPGRIVIPKGFWALEGWPPRVHGHNCIRKGNPHPCSLEASKSQN